MLLFNLFYLTKCELYLKLYLFNIVFWKWENVFNLSIYTDLCAHDDTCEGDIVMRQYKLLPSDVALFKIRKNMRGWHCHYKTDKIIALWPS